MKKILLIIICLLMITGCNKNKINEDEINNEKPFILEKVKNDKDYVYLSDYRNLIYEDKEYKLQNLIINIKSDDVDNINLELKSFVTRSFKDMDIDGNKVRKGNIISYDYHVTEKYISIIQRYYPYINGVIGEEMDNVYILSLETGKVLNNEDILKIYEYTQEELYELIKEKTDSEDKAYTIMNIKNNGYKLYIDKNNKLNIIYYEIDDNDSIRKELVLN